MLGQRQVSVSKECTKSWEEAQPGQLTQPGQRDIHARFI